MSLPDVKQVILAECIKPDGFAASLRDNYIDEAGFSRLIEAVEALAAEVCDKESIDRVLVACLFELPWEIENTVNHYRKQSPELGAKVSQMADTLRQSINNLLWTGLESYYE